MQSSWPLDGRSAKTIAVAMVIGGSYKLPKSLFDQGYTIASLIANEFTEVSSQIPVSTDQRPGWCCLFSRL